MANHEFAHDNDEHRVEKDITESEERIVTICELGRLVLQEYTKKDFWVTFIERVGGVEAIILGGIKKVL
ncbi:hypothetical protein KC953_00230 [Candidatus Saccharibacteria bacterium]|nr:hypothetical protein [Candidatus Saccharibacteria bacterium]